jgi:GT2 family glycosyltransferase
MASNSRPDISVIVLTYNTLQLTRACLHSLYSSCTSGKLSIEVIVVDNASTDHTTECLQAEFPTAQFIVNSSNLGFSRGNNIGLQVANGRYLMLLNSDTEVQPGALVALVAFMDEHPAAGACGPQLLNPDGTLQPSGRALPSVWSVFIGMTKLYRLWKRDFYLQPGRDYTQVTRVGELSGAALLVRREAYQKVGGLDPNLFAYYEDVDWCAQIGQAGYAIYYVPSAQVMHKWKGTSTSVSELSYRAGQNSERYYFAKHHGPFAHRAIQGLLLLKECAMIVAGLLRRNRSDVQFHGKMLANALTPIIRP